MLLQLTYWGLVPPEKKIMSEETEAEEKKKTAHREWDTSALRIKT